MIISKTKIRNKLPIPSPKPGQSEETFISECIADLSGEYSQEQASAICYRQLDLSKMNIREFKKYLMEGANPSFTGNSFAGTFGMGRKKPKY